MILSPWLPPSTCSSCSISAAVRTVPSAKRKNFDRVVYAAKLAPDAQRAVGPPSDRDEKVVTRLGEDDIAVALEADVRPEFDDVVDGHRHALPVAPPCGLRWSVTASWP